MSQKLILPLNQCCVNAGYQMPAYASRWGFSHYGIDLGNPDKQRTVYSPGDGTVIACGMDGMTASQRLGNAIVLVFPDVERNDGKNTSLACRMYHLESIAVIPGQTVKQGDVLGVYGNTGANTSGPHLHVEFDTDVTYPQYAVGIKSSGRVIKKGTIDSTVDPSKVWYLGQGQTIRDGWGGDGVTSGWVAQNDLSLPRLPENAPVPDYQALYEAQRKKTAEMTLGIREILEKMEQLVQ